MKEERDKGNTAYARQGKIIIINRKNKRTNTDMETNIHLRRRIGGSQLNIATYRTISQRLPDSDKRQTQRDIRII